VRQFRLVPPTALAAALALSPSPARAEPAAPDSRKAMKLTQEQASAFARLVASGDYAGEHWLASFAVYLLSTPGPE